jgi:hypothetical protein
MVRHIVIIGLLFLLLGGCNANLSYSSADSDATDAAKQLLLAVGKHWDVRTFDKEVVPGFYDTVKHRDVETLLAIFHRKLGAIRKIDLTQSSQRVSTGTGGTATEVDLVYDASFEKGTGQIELMTIDQGRGWSIEHLNVNSNALIQ